MDEREYDDDMQRLKDFVSKQRTVLAAKTEDQIIADLKAELAALKKKQEIESLRKQIEEAKRQLIIPDFWNEGTKTVDPGMQHPFWQRIYY